MIPGMYFIYSLVCDGQVFYIGCTKNMAARYKQHMSSHRLLYCITPVAVHIGRLLADNKSIEMVTIDYLPFEEARQKEKDVTYILSLSGQNIFNEQNASGRRNRKSAWPHEGNIRDKVKCLKSRQENREINYKCLNNIPFK